MGILACDPVACSTRGIGHRPGCPSRGCGTTRRVPKVQFHTVSKLHTCILAYTPYSWFNILGILNKRCPINEFLRARSMRIQTPMRAVHTLLSTRAIVSQPIEPRGLPLQMGIVDTPLVVAQMRRHPCCTLLIPLCG